MTHTWIACNGVKPDLPDGTLIYIRDDEGWESNASRPVRFQDGSSSWRWANDPKARVGYTIVAYRLAAPEQKVAAVANPQDIAEQRAWDALRAVKQRNCQHVADAATDTCLVCGKSGLQIMQELRESAAAPILSAPSGGQQSDSHPYRRDRSLVQLRAETRTIIGKFSPSIRPLGWRER